MAITRQEIPLPGEENGPGKKMGRESGSTSRAEDRNFNLLPESFVQNEFPYSRRQPQQVVSRNEDLAQRPVIRVRQPAGTCLNGDLYPVA